MKNTLEYKTIYDTLHPSQHYVADIASDLGIEARIVKHKRHTETCYEKAAILGWNEEPHRVVKALYFKDDSQRTIGIIIPETGYKLDVKKLFPTVVPEYAESGKKAKAYSQREPPAGMARGTCTPFPLEESIGQEINAIIFCDYAPTMGKKVDISIGGNTEEHFRTSMHIQYENIHRILEKRFGDSIALRRYDITDKDVFQQNI